MAASARVRLAGKQGLEPRFHGPEPCVLPLDDFPVSREHMRIALRVERLLTGASGPAAGVQHLKIAPRGRPDQQPPGASRRQSKLPARFGALRRVPIRSGLLVNGGQAPLSHFPPNREPAWPRRPVPLPASNTSRSRREEPGSCTPGEQTSYKIRSPAQRRNLRLKRALERCWSG